MGQASARKVTEIEETRRRLEADLRDLEDRLPASLRSLKSLVGLALGTTVVATFLAGKLRSKSTKRPPPAEVVVRVVRDDV